MGIKQKLPPLPEADVYGYKDSYSEELLLEYAKNAIDCHRTTKNHISDGSKLVGLSLSVDTKETQALLQSYLDGIDGWQLVPTEPTEEMKKTGGHINSEWLNDFAPVGEKRYAIPMEGVYEAMLAAAPKYTEGK